MVSVEEYEHQQALLSLYGKLAIAEQEITASAEGKDFITAVKQMREQIHGTEL